MCRAGWMSAGCFIRRILRISQNSFDFIWFHLQSWIFVYLRASFPPSLRWGHCSSSFPTRALRPGGGRLRARNRGGAREQAGGWAWLSHAEPFWESLAKSISRHKMAQVRDSESNCLRSSMITKSAQYHSVPFKSFHIPPYPTTTGHTWPHPAFEAVRARNQMRDVVVLALDSVTLRNHVLSNCVNQKRSVSEAVRLDTFTIVYTCLNMRQPSWANGRLTRFDMGWKFWCQGTVLHHATILAAVYLFVLQPSMFYLVFCENWRAADEKRKQHTLKRELKKLGQYMTIPSCQTSLGKHRKAMESQLSLKISKNI